VSVEQELGPPADPTVDPALAPPNDRHPVEPPADGGPIKVPPPASDGEEPVTELTDEERRWFSALLTVGRRSKTITVYGHPVVIQTLTTSDELRIGLYCRPYQETNAFARAYQVAVCASAVRSADGKPLFSSLSEVTSEDEVFDAKVSAVEKWYPIVVSQVHRAVMELEQEFAELAEKLGKAGG
jgi:hypothetical protein